MIDKMIKALEVLKTLEFREIQLVAYLNWKSIPQSYKLVNQFIVDSYRIEIYKLNNNTIVNIAEVGLFQIM
jgi:glutaredoxin-related protein